MENNDVLKGGEFLVRDANARETFIPEEFDEEQRMIAQTCEDFLQTEIHPNLDRIDKQEPGLMKSLVQKAGELGLLGVSIPEEYEGFGQSFLTSMKANEAIGSAYSYSVAFMAHTGIGTLPILYYGSEDQKQKYIPKLVTGELTAAYCLTEPGAGSDANAGKTRAVLSDDGKYYILNGQKMWITNGGFADVFTVFAKIENDRVLSAFIVDKKLEGITINPEEQKMGIKGSSTTQIFFNDVKVPVENLLGKRGEGFRIALNILHIGRIKLGGTVIGASKKAIDHSVNYANERKQFGQQISNFGAIKQKLSEQVIRTFATESALYRATKDIDDTIQKYLDDGMTYGEANVRGPAQFAIECALLKVYGSESLDYIVDEAVQIYGGMGFSSEAPVDRAYRDSRINRIFEGTNEINRLLMVDTALKRAMKGEIDLFAKAKEVVQALQKSKDQNIGLKSYYEEKYIYIRNFKDAVLMILGDASEKFKRKFISEQEIWMNIADMMIDLYAAESTLLRVEKIDMMNEEKEEDPDKVSIYKDILDILVYDIAARIHKSGSDAINSFTLGQERQLLLDSLQRFTKVAPINLRDKRRKIADMLIENNRYQF
ncbi:MAG: acyl-CoA dehydrogenase family protein [Bacteroidales bacterium]|nr:acyl-CoA dehydrogenase family protein [Bacteroidales bacterium]MCF8344835.1 acyl-CoA dehydrogenase family protein [Bacteroidales bacterium]MCF8352775.1 acyl-CoA dehydrogenase family protein [Bacteroidales bacterium]MCF8377023.1 acyl-CoA dehydrogenase family protein [Bacteroidales bacterium]MCF8400898.1 acyl-CoA dehydrogenase family protein [Bacteroidales bacterium]